MNCNTLAIRSVTLGVRTLIIVAALVVLANGAHAQEVDAWSCAPTCSATNLAPNTGLDVTSNLNTILTYAAGLSPVAIVKVECGTYIIGGASTTATSVNITKAGLIGQGRTCTSFVSNSSNTNGSLFNVTTGATGVYIAHFSITGGTGFTGGPSTPAALITWDAGTGAIASTLEDVELHGGYYGVYSPADGLGFTFLQNSWFYNQKQDSIYVNPTANAETTIAGVNFYYGAAANSAIHIVKTSAPNDSGGFYVDRVLISSSGSLSKGLIYEYGSSGSGTCNGTGSSCAAGYLSLNNSTIVSAGPALTLLNVATNYVTGNYLQSINGTDAAVVLDGTIITTVEDNHTLQTSSTSCVMKLLDKPYSTFAQGNNYVVSGSGSLICLDSSAAEYPGAPTSFIGELVQNTNPTLIAASAASATIYIDMPNQSFTHAQLPTTAAPGSIVYCSDCTVGACGTSGTGAVMHYTSGGPVCASY